MPNGPKSNGRSPRPDLPEGVVGPIQRAAARLAGVTVDDVAAIDANPRACAARRAMRAAMDDMGYQSYSIAEAMGYSRQNVFDQRKRWKTCERTEIEVAVYAEVQRILAKAEAKPAPKPAALFVQPGEPIPLPVRRQPSAREIVQAEMRRRQDQLERLKADGGGLRQWVD